MIARIAASDSRSAFVTGLPSPFTSTPMPERK
jgi:hypothetical protein